jgi:polar amino acid transport system substrate-binding protein
MKKILWLVLCGLMVVSMFLVSCKSSTAKIRVATDATWKPFEYVDDNKQIVGFDIDVMNAIAEKEKLNIEFVDVGWDPLLAGIAQGTYDCAISSITITDERKQSMLFSDPYFVAGQMVVVQASNTTITGIATITGTVGAQLGTTGAMEVEKVAGATLKVYDDIGLAFQDLMNGQINAVVCDSPVAQGHANRNPDKLKIVGGMVTSENYGIAVAKGKTDLLNKINAGIKAIKAEGLIEQLSEKWLQ